VNQSDYQPADRRPINSRDTRWAHRIANWLAEKQISPNAISVFGMLAAMVAGVAFAMTSQFEAVPQRLLWLVGGMLCQIRLLCNLFDGMVAVQQNQASLKGELYNEVPDRISDMAIFVGLAFSISGDLVAGFAAAMLAVFVAYVRAMAKSIGAKNDYCGPMAKPQRMALVTLLAAYMTLAPSDWHSQFGDVRIVLWVVVVGCVLTSIRRLGRAAKSLDGKVTS